MGLVGMAHLDRLVLPNGKAYPANNIYASCNLILFNNCNWLVVAPSQAVRTTGGNLERWAFGTRTFEIYGYVYPGGAIYIEKSKKYAF
jgi:hypothetical protein